MSETRSARELTYWLTRDADIYGNLSKNVDVWLARPKLYPVGDKGVMWMCEDKDLLIETAGGDCPAQYTVWSTDQCLNACRVYPETERECIRVGE